MSEWARFQDVATEGFTVKQACCFTSLWHTHETPWAACFTVKQPRLLRRLTFEIRLKWRARAKKSVRISRLAWWV